jgi:hypothetical protein
LRDELIAFKIRERAPLGMGNSSQVTTSRRSISSRSSHRLWTDGERPLAELPIFFAVVRMIRTSVFEMLNFNTLRPYHNDFSPFHKMVSIYVEATCIENVIYGILLQALCKAIARALQPCSRKKQGHSMSRAFLQNLSNFFKAGSG